MIDTNSLPKKIDSIIRFLFYVLIFWLPYSKAIIEICLITSVLLWLVKRILYCVGSDKPQTFKHLIISFQPEDNFLNRYIVLFMFACLLSIIGGVFWGISLRGFITKTMEWFAIYWLFIEVFKNRKHVLVFIAVFLFTAVSTALDAVIQFHVTGRDIFSGHPLTQGGRATAGFDHANGLAAYCIAVFPLFLAAPSVFRKKRKWNILLVICTVIMLWALVLTFSRAAWVGGIIGLAVFMFYKSRKALLPAIIPIVLITTVLGVGFYSSRASHEGRITSNHIAKSMGWRLNVWKDGIKMIKDRPLFGHGINTFMTLFQEYRHTTEKGAVYSATYAHNSYLQAATETGLVGLIFLLMLFGRLVLSGFAVMNRYVKGGLTDLGILYLGILSSIIAFLFHSFFDVNLYSLQLSVLLWLLAGLLVSTEKLLSNHENYVIKES